MPGKKTRAKAAVQAPGDTQPPPKPAPPPRTTHEPTRQVVDEYVKVVGVENVAGSGIQLLDCALPVNEIKGLPAIPEDVCSVRERLQKLQQEKGEPLKYLLRVNLQAGPVALLFTDKHYFVLTPGQSLTPENAPLWPAERTMGLGQLCLGILCRGSGDDTPRL